MAIIKENWEAIELLEQKTKEKTGDPEAAFHPNLFFFGEKQLLIPVKYRGKKGKKGQETFTKSYKEIMTAAQYCPFTGKPLYEKEEEINNQ